MINTIIYDLGGVLIDWNPAYLYRKLFANEEEMQFFLQNICTSDWNEEQDAGRTIKEATDMLVALHPEHEQNIRAFYGRWPEMLGGEVAGAVDIFRKLKQTGRYKMYALTNWSVETYPVAQQQFPFLAEFDGVVVSGEEKSRKPFPEFYKVLLDRYNVQPGEALFIDDNKRNIDAAALLGIHVIHFKDVAQLQDDLRKEGIEL